MTSIKMIDGTRFDLDNDPKLQVMPDGFIKIEADGKKIFLREQYIVFITKKGEGG